MTNPGESPRIFPNPRNSSRIHRIPRESTEFSANPRKSNVTNLLIFVLQLDRIFKLFHFNVYVSGYVGQSERPTILRLTFVIHKHRATNHQTRASNIHNFPSPTHTACSYVSPDNVLTKHLSLENFALNKYCDINAVMINYNTLKRQIHEDLRGIAWTRKDSRGLQRIRKDLFKFFKENSQILASFRDCAMQNCQNLVYVEL